MTATSKCRGHDIYYKSDDWYYLDSGESVPNNPDRICAHCKLPNRDDGCDPCIGKLPGVSNACCGHGSATDAYIQFAEQ